MSTRHLFLAFTNPAGASEEPFNAWYDNHHVPEVLRHGRGFLACRRYRLESGARAGGLSPWRYLALYDLQCDDLGLLASKPFRDDTPPLTPFRGLVEEDHVGWVYTPLPVGSASDPTAATEHPPFGDCLVLAWYPELDDVQLRAAMRLPAAQSAVRWSAHAYARAANQRTAQTNSPWAGLVIYEPPGVGAPSTMGVAVEAWTYVAVSGYVTREIT